MFLVETARFLGLKFFADGVPHNEINRDFHFDFNGFIFEAEKPFENVCATGASPVCAGVSLDKALGDVISLKKNLLFLKRTLLPVCFCEKSYRLELSDGSSVV